MKEIFKEIDKLLQEAKDHKSESIPAEAKSFYRGQISAYIKVGLLVQQFIAQQTQLSKQKHYCHVCGVLEGEKHRPICSAGNGVYYR